MVKEIIVSKGIVKIAITAMTFGIAANIFALPAMKMQSRMMFGATANPQCTPGTVCVSFRADETMPYPVLAEYTGEALVAGMPFSVMDNELLGGGKSWRQEFDILQLKQYQITQIREYITSIDGHLVNHLCDFTLSNEQLNRPQNMAFTVSALGNGHYSCMRS